MKTQRGFTLVELLVVVAIIGLLSSVVLASVNTARVRAQNVKRTSEIQQYKLALQLFADKNQYFPFVDTTGTPFCLGDYPTNNCGENMLRAEPFMTPSLINQLQEFIPGMPIDVTPVPYLSFPSAGYMYSCLATNAFGCTHIRLYWFLYKSNNCGTGSNTVTPDSNGHSRCELELRIP